MRSLISTLFSALVAVTFLLSSVSGEQPLDFGLAAPYAILAGSTVTSSGTVGTVVNGNIGIFPGTALVGFPPGVLNGDLDSANGASGGAQGALTTAYDALAGKAFTATLSNQDLGGMTLLPGVYKFDASAAMNGMLTLDAAGDVNAIWTFQIGSFINIAGASSVIFKDSIGNPDYVYWQVGTTATIAAGVPMVGNILALTSIIINDGTTVQGRCLARNAEVTLDRSTVSIPPTVTPNPSNTPSINPSAAPSTVPSVNPSKAPSASPSLMPSVAPSTAASASPSVNPTVTPSVNPSVAPSAAPSSEDSASPSVNPTVTPSVNPSVAPSAAPSTADSASPSVNPTVTPSVNPSVVPSANPSVAPSVTPSVAPSAVPSAQPSVTPSAVLSKIPTMVPSATPTPVQGEEPLDLGLAAPYAILAGSTVTSTGVVGTVVTGNIGIFPGSAITGFPPAVLNGAVDSANGASGGAQGALTTAYNVLASKPFNTTLSNQDLGGMTLLPGVYKFDGAATMNGMLTLDAAGDPKAVWMFQIGTTLLIAEGSSVIFKNSLGNPDFVYWQVGSSATLAIGVSMVGNILALASITVNNGATVNGRCLARNAAVTLDKSVITKPVVIAFRATQTVSGISLAQFNANATVNTAVMKSAIAATMPGVLPADVKNFVVSAGPTSRTATRFLRSPAAVAARALATDSIFVDYDVYVFTTKTAEELQTQLKTAVNDGSFNTYLQAAAAEKGATSLQGATSDTIATETINVDEVDSNSEDKDVLSTGAIIGIAIGGFFALMLICALIWYCMCSSKAASVRAEN